MPTERPYRPLVVWLTGLSGAGKTTLSEGLATALRLQNVPVLQLDGDVLRKGLNAGLGFSLEDRTENIRRTACVAALAAEQGMVAICSLISPLQSHRDLARSLSGNVAFIEVYVQCDLETCIRRDPKNLYKQALTGKIENFTGVSADYEPPHAPDLAVDTTRLPQDAAIDALTQEICRRLYEVSSSSPKAPSQGS